MKILQVTQRFYPSVGGSQLAVYHLAKELVALGHEVTVLTTSSLNNRDVRGFSTARPFTVRSKLTPLAPFEYKDGIKILRKRPLFQFWSYMVTPGMFLWLLRHVREYDVVHAHCYMFSEPDMAAWISKMYKKPFFLTAHDIITPFKGMYRFIKKSYDFTLGKATLRLCSKVISLTPENTLQYEALGVPSSKIELIPLGIDVEKFTSFHPDPTFKQRHHFQKHVLLFVARLMEYKGAQFIMEAAPEILKSFPDTSFVFVGEDQGFLSHLKQLATEKRVSSACHFMGQLEDKDLLNCYATADAFVFPSVGEGFGFVALEAKLMGLPTILASSGGLKYILQKTGGFPLDMNQAVGSQIVQHISFIFQNLKKVKEEALSQKSHIIHQFSWARTAQQYARLFER